MMWILAVSLILIGFYILRKVVIEVKEQLEALQLEVTRNTSLAASAVALIKGLADQIFSNANNPEALKELADHLRANDDLIAAALSANVVSTPPAPKQSTTAVVDEA